MDAKFWSGITNALIFNNEKGSRFDQLLSTTSTRVTWYQKWMDKCFFDYYPSLRTVAEVSKDVYMTFLKTLAAQGILEQKSVWWKFKNFIRGLWPGAIQKIHSI